MLKTQSSVESSGKLGMEAQVIFSVSLRLVERRLLNRLFDNSRTTYIRLCQIAVPTRECRGQKGRRCCCGRRGLPGVLGFR
jgi:hypothetical protein